MLGPASACESSAGVGEDFSGVDEFDLASLERFDSGDDFLSPGTFDVAPVDAFEELFGEVCALLPGELQGVLQYLIRGRFRLRCSGRHRLYFTAGAEVVVVRVDGDAVGIAREGAWWGASVR